MSRPFFFVIGLGVLLPTGAAAKGKASPPPAAPEPAPADISNVKDQMQILTDGQGHYIAVEPWDKHYKHLYYGDGKRFHEQRTSGGGREGKVAWSRVFWEPRVPERWQGGVSLKKDKSHSVQCGKRATPLTLVEGEERAKIMDGAKFYRPLWQYRPYALARDQKGTYFYVDRLREPENNKAFRLFAGPRGSLKPLKMTNVVSDSQGDIFSTKRGELRLVLDKKRSVWVKRKAETELTSLPIDENVIMIYTDLGVYAGQRLGTPCDDLM
jgi:hypothetical protein